MQTKHLSALIHIRNKDAVANVKQLFGPPVNFLLNIPRQCFFFGSFLLFVVRVIRSCLFLAALWSPAEKGLTS